MQLRMGTQIRDRQRQATMDMGTRYHGVGQSILYERSPQHSLQISVGGGKVAVLTVRLGHDPHSGVQASMVGAAALGRSEDSSVSHPCDVLKP